MWRFARHLYLQSRYLRNEMDSVGAAKRRFSPHVPGFTTITMHQCNYKPPRTDPVTELRACKSVSLDRVGMPSRKGTVCAKCARRACVKSVSSLIISQ